MKLYLTNPWNLVPKKAVELQKELSQRLIIQDLFGEIKTIAGADMAFSKDDKTGFAGIIVYSYPELKEIERVSATEKLQFPYVPYVPGLLSFREAPLLLKAIQRLKIEPDLFIFDGQGIAHPRRFGIASHMGIILDKPTIGCAKSRLIGKFKEPGKKAGSHEPLYDGEMIIGAVLRTRDNTNPVFVSPGHRVSLKTAVDIIMRCTDGYRIPRPTREADKYVASLKPAA